MTFSFEQVSWFYDICQDGLLRVCDGVSCYCVATNSCIMHFHWSRFYCIVMLYHWHCVAASIVPRTMVSRCCVLTLYSSTRYVTGITVTLMCHLGTLHAIMMLRCIMPSLYGATLLKTQVIQSDTIAGASVSAQVIW